MPLAEFAANNTASASTTVSPFLANFGQHPRIGPEPLVATVATNSTRSRFDQDQALQVAQTLTDLTTRLSEEMLIAQAVSEAQQNKDRRPARTYRVGDQVWLSAKNLRRNRPAGKLDHVAEGPFTVLRVSENNPLVVTLDLHSSMQIHPTFHASLLRPTATDPLPGQVIPPPDPVVIDEEPEYLVEQILDATIDKRYARGKVWNLSSGPHSICRYACSDKVEDPMNKTNLDASVDNVIMGLGMRQLLIFAVNPAVLVEFPELGGAAREAGYRGGETNNMADVAKSGNVGEIRGQKGQSLVSPYKTVDSVESVGCREEGKRKVNGCWMHRMTGRKRLDCLLLRFP